MFTIPWAYPIIIVVSAALTAWAMATGAYATAAFGGLAFVACAMDARLSVGTAKGIVVIRMFGVKRFGRPRLRWHLLRTRALGHGRPWHHLVAEDGTHDGWIIRRGPRSEHRRAAARVKVERALDAADPAPEPAGPYLRVDDRYERLPADEDSITAAIIGAASSEGFVAVHRSDDEYLQAALGRREPTALLLADGTGDWIVGDPGPLATADLIALLTDYAQGGDAFRLAADWRQ